MADTLTASQILRIRYQIGDYENQESGATVHSDEDIQSLYDDTFGSWTLTVIWGLQNMAGYYTVKINATNDFGLQESYRNLFQNAKMMLDYYTDLYNNNGGSALTGDATSSNTSVEGLGFLDTRIDTDST